SAVGYYTDRAGKTLTLAERWNGRRWKIEATPNASGPKSSRLTGVSCTGEKVCAAVGYYTNAAGKNLTLAERWNGRRWKLQATPNPAGAKSSRLNGVACTRAKGCTAVGYYLDAT